MINLISAKDVIWTVTVFLDFLEETIKLKHRNKILNVRLGRLTRSEVSACSAINCIAARDGRQGLEFPILVACYRNFLPIC